MSNYLIALVTLIYLGVAVSYWLEGNKCNAIIFAGYMMANIGFILQGVIK